MRRKKRKKKHSPANSNPKPSRSPESEDQGLMAQAIRAAYKAMGKRAPTPSSHTASPAPQPTSGTSSPVTRAHPAARVVAKIEGVETQVSPSSSDGLVDLVIGFDLGTSCTKIVIQDTARNAAFAVPFDGIADPSNSYLLSTIVYLDESGELNLQRRGTPFNQLKENMMAVAATGREKRVGHNKSLLPHTIAYIALVLRAARRWFFATHGDAYQQVQIAWQVNVGLPATRFDDDRMVKLYRSVIWRAWYLSTIHAPITLSTATRVHEQLNLRAEAAGNLLPIETIGTFPEVVAAVQAYARSPERQEGMHLLVDVGASTLDITCFRLLNYEYEDRYPIFCASVLRLGGFELFLFRAGIVTDAVTQHVDRLRQEMNGISELPDPLGFTISDTERRERDREFSNQVGEAIWTVIAATIHRDRHAPEWHDALPTFTCGGASKITLYNDALIKIDENTNWNGKLGIKELSLPPTVDAPNVPAGHRQRLLVAFGLSFNQLDIGDLIPPDGIPDPEDDPPRDIRDRYTGPEVL